MAGSVAGAARRPAERGGGDDAALGVGGHHDPAAVVVQAPDAARQLGHGALGVRRRGERVERPREERADVEERSEHAAPALVAPREGQHQDVQRREGDGDLGADLDEEHRRLAVQDQHLVQEEHEPDHRAHGERDEQDGDGTRVVADEPHGGDLVHPRRRPTGALPTADAEQRRVERRAPPRGLGPGGRSRLDVGDPCLGVRPCAGPPRRPGRSPAGPTAEHDEERDPEQQHQQDQAEREDRRERADRHRDVDGAGCGGPCRCPGRSPTRPCRRHRPRRRSRTAARCSPRPSRSCS